MRTLHNYIAAAKQRREDGEAGFSLIELIVVVAILGILVAIAIPVFGAIQDTARQNAADAVAANGATQASAAMANEDDPTAAGFFDNLVTGQVSSVTISAAPTLDEFCVTAVVDGETGTAGTDC